MKKQSMSKNAKEKKKAGILAITTAAVLVTILLCSLLAWYQLYELEKGILDVCATQQDAYVQLVLDQINLKENRDDEEIITDILSTLDSSSSKYWTFSKDRSMLFVKDVIETNRYKGLTTVSYYDSDSAKEFFESLQRNRVIHRSILVNDKEYVASGVAFQYGEEDYRLCLLTNKEVLLNNNKFMEAKIEMVLLVGIMLIALLTTAMLFARKLEQTQAVIADRDMAVKNLQEMVTQLNELLCQKEHYDTRYQLWSREVIKDFLEKLRMRDIRTVVAVRVHCMEECDRHFFLDRAGVVLDKKVLRFVLGDQDFLLLFIQYDQKEVIKGMEVLLNQGTVMNSVEVLKLGELNLDTYVSKLDAEV
jgi:hypothetical protein